MEVPLVFQPWPEVAGAYDTERQKRKSRKVYYQFVDSAGKPAIEIGARFDIKSI